MNLCIAGVGLTAVYFAFSGSGQLGTFRKPSPGDGEAGSPKKIRRMQGRKCDLRRSSAERLTAPSSLGAAPVEVTPGISGSVWEPVATPALWGRPRTTSGRIRLPVTDDDFADSGLGRRNSDVSGRIFGATAAGWLSYYTSCAECATDM